MSKILAKFDLTLCLKYYAKELCSEQNIDVYGIPIIRSYVTEYTINGAETIYAITMGRELHEWYKSQLIEEEHDLPLKVRGIHIGIAPKEPPWMFTLYDLSCHPDRGPEKPLEIKKKSRTLNLKYSICELLRELLDSIREEEKINFKF